MWESNLIKLYHVSEAFLNFRDGEACSRGVWSVVLSSGHFYKKNSLSNGYLVLKVVRA